MAEQEERKRGYGAVLLIILLLITIGFLVWLLLRPKMDVVPRIPTGNVDVFNIDISCSCDPDEDDDDDCKSDLDNIISYSVRINNRIDTTVHDDGIVYVDDNNGWYNYQKDLKIFENAAFQYTNKIAPGVSNSYDFRVHNVTRQAVDYKIKFNENSEYAINMLYRLRRNGGYIIGDNDTWVKASELESALQNLSGNSTDNYTLDWKWPYEGGVDEADTLAGEEMVSEYSLGIKITFGEA